MLKASAFSTLSLGIREGMLEVAFAFIGVAPESTFVLSVLFGMASLTEPTFWALG